MAGSLRLKAKAKVAVRKRKEAIEASDSSMVERILAKVSIPTPEKGKDGRDAPTMDEVLKGIIPYLPETKVEHTTVKETIDESIIDRMINAKLPEIQPEDRPTVEQITIDVSDEKLEEFITKKDFDKALIKIQRAIQGSAGGGGIQQLVKVTEVSETVTIRSNQLSNKEINIILVMSAGITVTLPSSDSTKIVWVQQGYEGTETFTVCKE